MDRQDRLGQKCCAGRKIKSPARARDAVVDLIAGQQSAGAREKGRAENAGIAFKTLKILSGRA